MHVILLAAEIFLHFGNIILHIVIAYCGKMYMLDVNKMARRGDEDVGVWHSFSIPKFHPFCIA